MCACVCGGGGGGMATNCRKNVLVDISVRVSYRTVCRGVWERAPTPHPQTKRHAPKMNLVGFGSLLST